VAKRGKGSRQERWQRQGNMVIVQRWWCAQAFYQPRVSPSAVRQQTKAVGARRLFLQHTCRVSPARTPRFSEEQNHYRRPPLADEEATINVSGQMVAGQ
jgi:hypothetical protein